MKYSVLLIFIFILSCMQTGKGPSDQELVRDSGPAKVYNRKDYKHWVDEDKDCQNTRHEILIETSLVAPVYKTKRKCLVTLGKWYDPYSDQFYYSSKELDLDHLIPLKKAHSLGASFWSKEKKEAFANDPLNLILVNSSLNRQKGAKGPREWMPPNRSYHCIYLKKWRAVEQKYKLKKARGLASLKTQACTE